MFLTCFSKVATLAGIASRDREQASKFVADRGEFLKSVKAFDNYQDIFARGSFKGTPKVRVKDCRASQGSLQEARLDCQH